MQLIGVLIVLTTLMVHIFINIESSTNILFPICYALGMFAIIYNYIPKQHYVIKNKKLWMIFIIITGVATMIVLYIFNDNRTIVGVVVGLYFTILTLALSILQLRRK